MRRLFLALPLVLALGAQAAERPEVIRFEYASALEVESILLRGSSPTAGSQRSLLPDGITVFTADTRGNTLSVAGTPQAIAEVKRLIRFLDVPQRRIRLSVHVVELAAAELDRLPFANVQNDGLPPIRVAVLNDDQAAGALGRARRVMTDTVVTCLNNRPLRIFWPAREDAEAGQAKIQPRLNGDETVTLLMEIPPAPARPDPARLPALSRVGRGETMLVLTPDGTGLLVKADPLPEAPGPRR